MNSRSITVLTGVIVAVILLTGTCAAGFVAGRVLNPSLPNAGLEIPVLTGVLDPQSAATDEAQQAATPDDLEGLFKPFWQSWDLLHEQYVDQPVDDELLMRGAIKGMLEALGDQHTSYLDPEMYERSTLQLDGEEYEGIGAWVDVTGDYLTIISPMPGSPAAEAGLRPGDQVIAVNGEDMTGVDGEVVRQQVIGPEGSTVRLTILREGETEPFEVEVERANIIVPTVEGRMLEDNIAYVKLYTFGDDTAQDLRQELRALMRENPSGMILDLRNNGGGYLHTAIDVVSEFIDEGVVMVEEYGNGDQKVFESEGGGTATEVPLVVLINQGSASASEIVAGAIQDRGRGQLIGETSFGKGSVQAFTPLENDSGAVRVTIARWLTPDGGTIHEVGLEPDIKVEYTEADFEANRDPQLDKAVEVLSQ